MYTTVDEDKNKLTFNEIEIQSSEYMQNCKDSAL